jgi:hypothetical protein
MNAEANALVPEGSANWHGTTDFAKGKMPKGTHVQTVIITTFL